MPWSFNFSGLFNTDSWFSGNFISSLGSWSSNSLTSIMLDPRYTLAKTQWQSGGALFNYSGSMSIGDNCSFGQTAIWQPSTTTGTSNTTGAATTSGSSSTTGKTTAEQKAERINQKKTSDKIKTLTEILTKFKESKTCSDQYDLEDSLTHLPSKIDDKYEALQGIYNKYKTEIQTMLKKDINLDASSTVKSAATSLKNSISSITDKKYTSVLTTDTPPKLKSDIDVISLLSELQNSGTSFHSLYHSAYNSTSSNDKKNSLNSLYSAISKALVAKADSILASDGISDETKGKIQEYTDMNRESNSANKLVKSGGLESLYYWIRIAEAEIADSKYKLLSEDFPNDDVLKAGANVKKVKADMAKEGMKYAKTE